MASIHKLAFDIVASSGSDEDYPAKGLTTDNHTCLAKGWQSERFCIYPQAIIFSFTNGQCRLQKIQILGHHYKIPRKLEFFIGQKIDTSLHEDKNTQNIGNPGDMDNLENKDQYENIQFKRLGYVDLLDNSENNFKVRELKSIHVDVQGTHLKIIVHKCHINPVNLYNQVGLIALNLLGQVIDTDFIINNMSEKKGVYYGLRKESDKDDVLGGFVNNDAIDRRIAIINDLGFDLSHDPEIVRFMGSISRAKESAVKNEQYSLAKALKVLFDLSKKIGDRVSHIQIAKDVQVQSENYENADKLKRKIDTLKMELKVKMNSLGLEIKSDASIGPIGDHYDFDITLHKIEPQNPIVVVPIPAENETTTKEISPEATELKLSHVIESPIQELQPIINNPETHIPDPVEAPQSNNRSSSPPLPVHQKNKAAFNVPEYSDDYDPNAEPTRPTRAPKPRSLPSKIPSKKPATANNSRPKSTARKSNPEADIEVSEIIQHKKPIHKSKGGKQATLPPGLEEPDKLSLDKESKYSTSIEVFNTPLVQCAIGIKFKCKEWALEEASTQIDEWDVTSQSMDRIKPRGLKKNRKKETFESTSKNYNGDWISNTSLHQLCKATMELVNYNLEDAREKTSDLTIKLWTRLLSLINKYDPDSFKIFQCCEESVHLLLNRCSDLNPRTKTAANSLVSNLLKIYHESPTSLMPELIAPVAKKKTVLPRIVKSRLDIIYNSIRDYGINGKTGLSTKSVYDFVLPLIENTNAEVRDSAYNVASLVGKIVGETILEKYTEKLRPPQKAKLMEKLANQAAINIEENDTPEETVKPSIKAKEKVSGKAIDSKETVSQRIHDKDDVESVAQSEKGQEKIQKRTTSAIAKKLVPKRAEISNLKKVVKKPSTAKSLIPKAKVIKDEASKPQTAESNFEAIAEIETQDQIDAKSEVNSKPQTAESHKDLKKEIGISKTVKKIAVQPKASVSKPNSAKSSNRANTPKSGKKVIIPEKTCLFCEKKSVKFDQEGLEKHYETECAYLTTCPKCKLFVEVQVLYMHMNTECELAEGQIVCKRCHQRKKPQENHVKCKLWNSEHDLSICGLCNKSIIGKSGWKVHLKDGGCAQNTRLKKKVGFGDNVKK